MIDTAADKTIIRPLGPVTVRRTGAPGLRGPLLTGRNSNDIEEQAAWHA
jgi:hypothetical protein